MTDQGARDSVGTRFLFDDAAGRALRHAFLADAAEARLSVAFRAYYQLRPWIPVPVRRFLQGYRKVKQPSDWYLPQATMTALLEQLQHADPPVTAIHPWPDNANWAAVLTHDVESQLGLQTALRLANIEQDLGLRSCWNLVPHLYPIDWGIVNELRARGCEIAIHGFNHDGRLFESPQQFARRVGPINAALEQFEAVGFRAPMVHRNFEWLQQLNIEYDASAFDTDPYQAMPGGIGGIWPFICGDFVELPYTLPQDHTLLIGLGALDGDIWHTKLEYVIRHHGMALLVTHPDYLYTPAHLDLYRNLLEQMLANEPCWHALPRDVARWWRARDQSRCEAQHDGPWRIVGPAAGRGAIANFLSDGRELTVHRLTSAGVLDSAAIEG